MPAHSPVGSGARAPVDAQHTGAACGAHEPPRECPWKPRSDRLEGVPLEGASRKFARSRRTSCFFGTARWSATLVSMPMPDEQIKEQISYLETRIERQRAIIDGLEAEGYGGEVIRRSRVLLKQMIADLDQLLLQLREARQINVVKAEQKIPSSAASQNSIDR